MSCDMLNLSIVLPCLTVQASVNLDLCDALYKPGITKNAFMQLARPG